MEFRFHDIEPPDYLPFNIFPRHINFVYLRGLYELKGFAYYDLLALICRDLRKALRPKAFKKNIQLIYLALIRKISEI